MEEVFTDQANAQLGRQIFNITVAGSENYVEDGLVPLSSVLAGKYIYQGIVKHYTQVTFTGKLAQHSALPQNREVLDLIRRYVLNHNNRRQANN